MKTREKDRRYLKGMHGKVSGNPSRINTREDLWQEPEITHEEEDMPTILVVLIIIAIIFIAMR